MIIEARDRVSLDGAQLLASTGGQGNAGNIFINARDRVTLDNGANIFSAVGSVSSDVVAEGSGGRIRITTGSFSLTNNSNLVALTLGRGDAGSVIINARDRVAIDSSAIFSSVGAINSDAVAVGGGGDIRITAGSLSLTNGAQLVADTRGQGNAGDIILNARGQIALEGVNRQEAVSVITSSSEAGAQGRGGDIRIAADSVRLADGGGIFSSTRNRFPGGSITLNANTFEATGGSQVNTSSNNRGRAGNIILDVADRITLSGLTNNRPSSLQGSASGLYASTAPGSSAPGGTIQITTDQLQVLDQARIAVDSQGSGIGGNVDLAANTVQLDNQARITAETVADDGGNIRLRDVELLQLNNNSLITTTAGTERAGGNGGNIDIDADFIVALPNARSDIRANAFTGTGGTVNITTKGLFGIAAQAQDNPLTSDITASSELGVQRTVDITPPSVDSRRGLTELPVAVVDASDQITQTCPGVGGRGETGEFVVTGRGGLPTAPIDSLLGEESLMGWSTLDEREAAVAPQFPEGVIASPHQETAYQETNGAAAIVEAQEWIVAEDGTVRLIAVTPTSAAQTPVMCQSPEN
ncbi:S-layer family protein [Leptolyngbya sp. FACHB-541]|uniref:beta strand repeat-containing protein n=1 Tax=Leptolyngbya sp. FACHB-541 TaxID=2692810 RepID=UPI0016866F7E|nr:S-layer family protein [Leptolyngbya sp. FACHB-541]MBD1998333.1 S-layer family protein [Leptolyngbya sp. FACHB-541]